MSATADIGTLGNDVSIHFDEQQRPWVVAEGLDDALVAEGWLHARHRLWQMELLRRAGRAQLASVLGRSLLETDKSLWTAGVPQLAERLLDEADAEMLQRIDRYIDGVNAGIDSYSVRPADMLLAGINLEHWSRIDVFAVGAIIAFQSANNMDRELLRYTLAGKLDDNYLGRILPR